MFYGWLVGQSKNERTWRTPKATRHVWVRLPADGDGPGRRKHPHQTPRQGLLLAWRRRAYRWQALVVLVDDPELDGTKNPQREPVILQLWVDASDLRPVPADPNRAFGLR